MHIRGASAAHMLCSLWAATSYHWQLRNFKAECGDTGWKSVGDEAARAGCGLRIHSNTGLFISSKPLASLHMCFVTSLIPFVPKQRNIYT